MKSKAPFYLQPDAELLLKYGYINHAIISDGYHDSSTSKYDSEIQGYVIRNQFRQLDISPDQLKKRMTRLAYKHGIETNVDTLLYVILEEYDNACTRIDQEELKEKHLTTAYEFSRLLDSIINEKIYEMRLIGNTNGSMLHLKDSHLLEWIKEAVIDKVLSFDRSVLDLGPDVQRLLMNGTQFRKLERKELSKLSLSALKKPSKTRLTTRKTAIVTESLLIIWNFINQETNLKAPNGVKFLDHQLAFLQEVAEELKLKNYVSKEIKAKRMSSMFDNYLKRMV